MSAADMDADLSRRIARAATRDIKLSPTAGALEKSIDLLLGFESSISEQRLNDKQENDHRQGLCNATLNNYRKQLERAEEEDGSMLTDEQCKKLLAQLAVATVNVRKHLAKAKANLIAATSKFRATKKSLEAELHDLGQLEAHHETVISDMGLLHEDALAHESDLQGAKSDDVSANITWARRVETLADDVEAMAQESMANHTTDLRRTVASLRKRLHIEEKERDEAKQRWLRLGHALDTVKTTYQSLLTRAEAVKKTRQVLHRAIATASSGVASTKQICGKHQAKWAELDSSNEESLSIIEQFLGVLRTEKRSQEELLRHAIEGAAA